MYFETGSHSVDRVALELTVVCLPQMLVTLSLYLLCFGQIQLSVQSQCSKVLALIPSSEFGVTNYVHLGSSVSV